jgi:type IX secretion system PorP/SprF family membrane protein
LHHIITVFQTPVHLLKFGDMKFRLTFSLLIISNYCFGQQDPIYAQYLLNPLVINPANTGLNNNFNAMAGYRVQWAGFEGQPNTLNLSAHTSLLDNKAGVGVLLINDQIGNITNTESNVAFSYKLQFDRRLFSFGMQAGVQRFRVNYNDLAIYDPGDVAFANGERGSRLNIGAGMIFKSDHLFIGISVPRLLPTTFRNGTQEFELYNQHYYLMSSYLYYLNETVWLKPSIVVRGVKAAPASIDFTMNFILSGKHQAGIFTRSLNTYGLLIQSVLHDRFLLGYVFEVPTNKSVGARFTTHEINLGIRLSVFSFHDKTVSNF